jgi:hypothetical protein
MVICPSFSTYGFAVAVFTLALETDVRFQIPEVI